MEKPARVSQIFLRYPNEKSHPLPSALLSKPILQNTFHASTHTESCWKTSPQKRAKQNKTNNYLSNRNSDTMASLFRPFNFVSCCQHTCRPDVHSSAIHMLVGMSYLSARFSLTYFLEKSYFDSITHTHFSISNKVYTDYR